jgi:hemoglobin-like flavoprotein
MKCDALHSGLGAGPGMVLVAWPARALPARGISVRDAPNRCEAKTKTFFATTDMKEQKKKLLGALVLVIQNLRKPETPALAGLGQRHATYGMRPEHYPIVGAVLLDAFAAVLGERGTPARRDAWAQTYEAICALMLQVETVPALA